MMKNVRLMAVIVPLVLLSGAAGARAAGAPAMGISAGRDLDALWAAAQKTHDLDHEDAIVLLESRTVRLEQDGTAATRVHKVVWINSAVGIRGYADLRVPWDSADSGLDVEILRTWRDGRWWPDPAAISETAVVHTLPRALERADDYCALRETMLLHDGIELPCILETAYTVTERGLPAADGLFRFPQRDSAVLVELEVDAPEDLPLHHQEINGAPVPAVRSGGGRRAFVWTMSPVPALRLPVTEQPEAYEPAVVWSTWPSWEALAAEVLVRFDAAARAEGALADSLASRTRRAMDQVSLVRTVLDFVDESVRKVPYDDSFWRFAPRPASRTWDTGYGHDLDRAVLAAGALRSPAVVGATGPGPRGDLAVSPVFVGRGRVAVAPLVPRLDGIGSIALAVTTRDGPFLWSPATGLDDGAWTYDRPTTVLDPLRPMQVAASAAGNHLALSLTLTPGKDREWDCAGVLSAAGTLNVHGLVTGAGKTLDQAVGEVLGSLLEGLTIRSGSPRSFREDEVSLEFAGVLKTPEADDEKRVTLLIGSLGDGLMDTLPGDVHLYEETRGSPVLSAAADQQVTLRMNIGGTEVLHLPAAVDIANTAGSFHLECAVQDGWLTYRRTLAVSGAGPWPELRRLLLEDTDPARSTIILKEMEAE